MTSSSREDCSFQMFSPTTPHFFKIILDETLQENKLRIPPKFARKHMETLTGWTILKLPSGSKWEVEVIKCDGEVWLEKGWSKFADHNSLKSGDFVVFRYEMDSQFNVFIFDRSATEIDYVYQPFTRSNKKSKAVEENRIFKEPRKTEFVRKKTLSTIEKERALERTSDFKSKNPYFKVVMQPTYVKRCSAHLELPKIFAERYLDVGSSDVILKLLDGNTWFSKMVLIETCQRKRFKLHHGWNNFACDNNLQVGDVCVFVLKSTNIDHFMFEVLIFHANENLNSPVSSGGFKSLISEGKNFGRKPIKRAAVSTVKASKALKNASKYIPKNPIFKVTKG